MTSCTLLLLLASCSAALAGHFYGGTMTFTPKGQNPDGSFRVDFRYKHTYDNCNLNNEWSCLRGDCGHDNSFKAAEVDRANGGTGSHGDGWCTSEALLTKNIQINHPFEMRKTGCCWIYNSLGSGESWALLTQVDLGIRSDTHEPNRSPVTAVLPFIRIPQNCPRRLNLLAHDPEKDQVRCRYGLGPDECYHCHHHPGFYLDKNSCTLTYQNTSIQDAHIFELVLEDFPRQHITLSYTDGTSSSKSPLVTRRKRGVPMGPAPHMGPAPPLPSSWQNQPINTPAPNWGIHHPNHIPSPPPHALPTDSLSNIPLHFAIQVDPPVHSCTEGELLPRFLSPTPWNGEFLEASVNHELEIRLKATATQSWVNNFIISGPLNITKYNIPNGAPPSAYSGADGEALIRWTPTENDAGDHVPICFIAESVSGSRIFHSEMRCIIVVIGYKNGKANVICNENIMTVELEKSSISGLHEDHLRLNDPSCTPISNATHVIAAMSLSSCGTILEEDADNLIFKNEITSYDKLHEVITRKHQVEIGFSCSYPKKGKVSMEFRAHKIPFVFTQKGFGKFTYQFEFYHSPQFNRMVDPSTYPVEVPLREMLYMDIKATSSTPNTELFVESCRATPVDDPTYHVFYKIFENGCTLDETVVIYPSGPTEFKFGIQAFTFIGEHEEVFISCSVILCVAGNPFTRCSQGCINATAAPAVPVLHHRRRRAAAVETVTHYVSQGPLRQQKLTGIVAVSNMSLSLSMNLAFIAAVLLVAVAVVVYAAKRSNVKYQPLPSADS